MYQRFFIVKGFSVFAPLTFLCWWLYSRGSVLPLLTLTEKNEDQYVYKRLKSLRKVEGVKIYLFGFPCRFRLSPFVSARCWLWFLWWFFIKGDSCNRSARVNIREHKRKFWNFPKSLVAHLLKWVPRLGHVRHQYEDGLCNCPCDVSLCLLYEEVFSIHYLSLINNHM